MKKQKVTSILYMLLSLFFVVPSVYFVLTGQSFVILEKSTGFIPLLNLWGTQAQQQTVATIAIIILGLVYLYICNNDFFEDHKKAFLYIAGISLIFWVIIPITSTDTYYYVSIGGLTTYNVNPYLTTMREFVEAGHQAFLQSDGLLNLGYNNFWNGLLVVYEPLFTSICSFVGHISFQNEVLAVYIYKFITLVAHLVCAHLFYKISGDKKIMIIYGLNPFALLQYITNGHNDIFVLMFILFAIYFLLKKKNLFWSVIFLGLASSVKFITILFLPFFILYHVQEKTAGKRFIDCLKYGLIFGAVVIIAYLPYLTDISVVSKFLEQRDIYSFSIYSVIYMFFGKPVAEMLKNVWFAFFAIAFVVLCFYFLFKKKIEWKSVNNTCMYVGLAFICLVLTNLKGWYLAWLFPFLTNTKHKNRLLIQSIIMELLILLSNDKNITYPTLAVANILGTLIVLGVIKFVRKRKELKKNDF